MIIMNVTYKCKAGMRGAFLDMLRQEGIDRASRAEAGNMKYDYYLSVDNGDELLLLEIWQDEEAKKGHGGQPHMKRLQELKALYVEETVIDRFTVDGPEVK